MKREHPLELGWITFIYTKGDRTPARAHTYNKKRCVPVLFECNAAASFTLPAYVFKFIPHACLINFWCMMLLASNASKVSYSISSPSLNTPLLFLSSFFFSFPICFCFLLLYFSCSFPLFVCLFCTLSSFLLQAPQVVVWAIVCFIEVIR